MSRYDNVWSPISRVSGVTQLIENFWVPRLAAGTLLIYKASLLIRTLGKKYVDAC